MTLEFNAPSIDTKQVGPWPTDIRDPSDELVATGFIHVENMDDSSWWIGIYTADGRCVHVKFWTKRAKIHSSMEDQGPDDLWGERIGSQIARLTSERDELLEAAEAGREAMDILFSMLIEQNTIPRFFPSKSGKPWENLLKINAAIAKARGEA